MSATAALCQVALSVRDVDATVRFYAGVFGFVPSGGTSLFRGPIADRIAAVPDVRNRVRWMNDRDPSFQLELFQFENPPYRRPADKGPNALGFRKIGIWVQDYEGVASRLRENGANVLSETPDDGTGRRLCCEDPDGVLLEVFERDPGPPDAQGGGLFDLPVRTRTVTLSVRSLHEAERYLGRVVGLARHPASLRAPEKNVRSAVFVAGSHLLEVVEHDPPGEARADATIGDAGIYHCALRFPDAEALDRAHADALAASFPANSAPVHLWVATIVYLRPLANAIVEYVHFRSWIGCLIGFRRHEPLLPR